MQALLGSQHALQTGRRDRSVPALAIHQGSTQLIDSLAARPESGRRRRDEAARVGGVGPRIPAQRAERRLGINRGFVKLAPETHVSPGTHWAGKPGPSSPERRHEHVLELMTLTVIYEM